jgi:hypothetical protein
MQTLKNLCAIVLMTLLLITSVAGCQQPPVPLPAPPPPFQVSATPEEAHYLPGESVEVKLSLTNVSSEPITLDTYPPEIQVKPTRQDEVVFSVAAGTQPLEISPNDTITLEFTWDQKDNEGKQAPAGWYAVTFEDIKVTQGDRRTTFNPGAAVLIQYPQGAMEKTIEPNESRAVNGITVTLERFDLTSSGMTVYAVGTLSGYPVPPGITNTANAMEHVSAEYSVDGDIVKQAGSAGMQYLENGTRFIWDRHVDPIPSDAKELIFRIGTITLRFAPDRPDELVDGPWEFKVPLD